MIEIRHLLEIIDAYRSATGVPDTTVSHRVFGDTKKIGALRGDGDITTDRFNKAVIWFSENWPINAAWPATIARPSVPAEEAADVQTQAAE